MYAFCKICGYDTGDHDTARELKEIIDSKGGYLAINSIPPDRKDNTCPFCKAVNTLKVD